MGGAGMGGAAGSPDAGTNPDGHMMGAGGGGGSSSSDAGADTGDGAGMLATGGNTGIAGNGGERRTTGTGGMGIGGMDLRRGRHDLRRGRHGHRTGTSGLGGMTTGIGRHGHRRHDHRHWRHGRRRHARHRAAAGGTADLAGHDRQSRPGGAGRIHQLQDSPHQHRRLHVDQRRAHRIDAEQRADADLDDHRRRRVRERQALARAGVIVTWPAFTLAAGQTQTVSFISQVLGGTANGTLVHNIATVNFPGGSVMQSRDVLVDATQTLRLTLTEDRDPVRAGDQLTYTIIAGNTGTQSLPISAAGVVSATIPAGTTFVSASRGRKRCERRRAVECRLDRRRRQPALHLYRRRRRRARRRDAPQRARRSARRHCEPGACTCP